MATNALGSDRGTQVFFMLLAAGIFAYFGFAGSWAHQYTTTTPPVLLPMVVLLKWTLRAGAIGMGLAALISLSGSILGPLLYSIVGLLTAIAFVVVGIWEMTNSQGYFSGVPAILLFVFAAWNGFHSFVSLQGTLSSGRHSQQPPMASSDRSSGTPTAV